MTMTTKGKFGRFGGQFVPETLMTALQELEEAYEHYKQDESFQQELRYYLKEYVGRETPLYFAQRLTKHCGGAKIYLKREDLNHTGAHKINNALGQALLAKKMGKTKIVAETGAGQHGEGVCRPSGSSGRQGGERPRRRRLELASRLRAGEFTARRQAVGRALQGNVAGDQ